MPSMQQYGYDFDWVFDKGHDDVVAISPNIDWDHETSFELS